MSPTESDPSGAQGGSAGAPRPALTGSDGRKWYIRKRADGRGYVPTLDPDGACRRMPADAEIIERLDGVVVAARRSPRRILELEAALVRQSLADPPSFAHACEVWGGTITIYANARDRAPFTESLDAEFAEGFAAALEEFFAKRYGRGVAHWFRTRRTGRGAQGPDGRDSTVKPGVARRGERYFPLLRFTLARRRERLFRVERVCFVGDRRWQALETLPLREAVEKYVPHLGRATFFDLLAPDAPPGP